VRFDDIVRSSVPPRVRTGQWVRLIAALEEPGAGRASHAADALEAAGRLIARRGMVVLVSDLLMERDDVVSTVRGLRNAGHQVVVMHVLDPAELYLPQSNEALFVDPESGLEVATTVADVRAAYQATVREALAEWRRSLTAYGASYEPVITDAPFGVPLRRAFSARQEAP